MDWPRLVREIIEDARRRAGTGPVLAQRLEEMGAGREQGRYSESAISNWIKGRAMPPADVLLAAATVASISLDDRLAQATSSGDAPPARTDSAPTDVDVVVRDLRRQLGQLQAQVIDLYGRLGFPIPREPEASDDQSFRRASGGHE